MEIPDIRRSISLQIDKEVKELINICSVDKLAQKICSEANFWEQIFEEYKLPFPNILHNNAQVWISTFEKERKLKFYTDRLMEILEYPEVDDFEYVDPDDTEVTLFVNIDQCPFLEVFNIPEIDYNELSLIVNSYILDKLNGKRLDYIPSATIDIIDNKYELTISTNYSDYVTNIERQTVKTIFYRILSYGAIPFDTVTSNPVKLNK